MSCACGRWEEVSNCCGGGSYVRLLLLTMTLRHKL